LHNHGIGRAPADQQVVDALSYNTFEVGKKKMSSKGKKWGALDMCSTINWGGD